jgi:hypothetical protein
VTKFGFKSGIEMAKSFIAIAAGMAMAGLAASASASTVNLDYLGSSTKLNGNVVESDSGSLNNVTLGSLDMQFSGTQNGFIAWCFQFARQIALSATYTVEAGFPSFLSSQQADDLSRLFTGYGNETLTNRGAASFQLAIWEIVEETKETSPGVIEYNISTGNFQAEATSGPRAAEDANTWLASLGQFSPDARITYLTSSDSQDILTIAPIPLPASVLLLGAGLGALVLVRRRGKASAVRD